MHATNPRLFAFFLVLGDISIGMSLMVAIACDVVISFIGTLDLRVALIEIEGNLRECCRRYEDDLRSIRIVNLPPT